MLVSSGASIRSMLASTDSPGAFDPLDDLPRCGLADLDAAMPLRPGTLTLVDAAAERSDALYAWLADVAVTGRYALVADGGNFLDAYRLATAARRRAAARHPDASRRDQVAFEEIALERVRLARGFTAYQLHAIIEDILPAAADDLTGRGSGSGRGRGAEEEAGAGEVGPAPSPATEPAPLPLPLPRPLPNTGSVGLFAAPGLLDMYLDDELSRDESRTLVARALSTLRRLAARHHAPAVVMNSALSPRSDHPLRILLDESVDEHVILRGAPMGGTHVLLPRRGAAFLAPGPGRTRLEDYLDPDERSTPIAPIPARKPGAWTSNGNRMYGKFGEARRREPGAVLAAREVAS